MFEVGVVVHFEAAHSLRGDFGPASRLHGHTYRVEVTARGSSLQEDGTLCDLGLLQQAAQESVARFHYRNLDDLEEFVGRNTTAEAVAEVLFRLIVPSFAGQRVQAMSVRVWESPHAFAAYEDKV